MTVIDNFIAPACHQQIETLYQDEHILLINKPSGLLSLSGKNPLNLDSVHHRLAQIYPQITLIHRLDFGTSGIMLLALDKASNALLSQQFQQRTVIKGYQSIVAGHIEQDSGIIAAPISKDKALFPRLKVCFEQGQKAISHFQVLERLSNPDRTRLLFTPETGRTHQLRIHSQFIGHPMLGCDLYGNLDTQAMASRLLLHASELEFEHPFTGQAMKICCPCPF
ncbi:RluA family pseudouridine synthase [Rheinheimera sediminis]|uniref:RluA family pseudouridine synthase n=1 Tax=Rheinheimera sp. YQF-1 TaxID=2499626 RepID=UPI000FD775D3|nr:RluA family pseudouridine synthase [Rheinheimera sp. YQF-1]RVT48630.1 RluA family pseudouridine synthase [Rheinheimera sp. YQF-1]